MGQQSLISDVIFFAGPFLNLIGLFGHVWTQQQINRDNLEELRLKSHPSVKPAETFFWPVMGYFLVYLTCMILMRYIHNDAVIGIFFTSLIALTILATLRAYKTFQFHLIVSPQPKSILMLHFYSQLALVVGLCFTSIFQFEMLQKHRL